MPGNLRLVIFSPMLVNKVLPASLLGFFAAVIFGAILSSFNSVLNSAMWAAEGRKVFECFKQGCLSHNEIAKLKTTNKNFK